MKLCYNGSMKTMDNETSEEANVFKSTQYDKYSQSYNQDSFQNVKKCWWQNKELNCSGLFLNHFLDAGTAFTFNPSRSFFVTQGNQNMNYQLPA